MKKLMAVLFSLFLINACSSSSSSSSSDDSSDPSDFLDESHFRTLVSATTTSCTLSNGSTTTCYELTFNVNDIEDGTSGADYDAEGGPYCPTDRTSTDGGLGSYDGADGGNTNVIQLMNSTLWDQMESDGYDLFTPGGSICTSDLLTNTTTGMGCSERCLENSVDDTLTAKFLIPVTPELLDDADPIGEIEHIGVSLDGVPFTGTPPSVTANSGNIPALDRCGGHVDPSGYYHWHFITEAMDTALAGFGISSSDASCNITQDDDALFGYAKDGFPIYSTKDNDGTTPSDLDECNGHTGDTPEFGEIYHYHAVAQSNAPNFPPCVTGASVAGNLTPIIE